MRIISGRLSGREFRAPGGHRSHPMSDKVRGAIFNMLGDIEDLNLLDAFAGSGALGFEAISRGAATAVLIDSDRMAQRTISENINALGVKSKTKLISANSSSWSDNNAAVQFDLVFVDPPYDNLQLKLLQKLVRHVKDNGLYILSWPGGLTLPEFATINLLSNKKYGDAQVGIFRK